MDSTIMPIISYEYWDSKKNYVEAPHTNSDTQ